MTHEQNDRYGPRGDPKFHRSFQALMSGLEAARQAPRESGRLEVIYRHGPDHSREALREVSLTPLGGLPGDLWGVHSPARLETQLAVMQLGVAKLIAGQQALSLFGDNLFVDFDLSEASLPCGSILLIGDTLLEVTPEPHTGCKKFKQRFGLAALEWTLRPEHRPLRLRGLYLRVLQGGRVHQGDAIELQSLPHSN